MEIGHRGVLAFYADGDVAGGINIEKRPARAAAAHAAVQVLIKSAEVVRIGQEVFVPAAQVQQARGNRAIVVLVAARAGLAETVALHHEIRIPLLRHFEQRLDVVDIVIHQHGQHVDALPLVNPSRREPLDRAQACAQAPGEPRRSSCLAGEA